MSLRFAPSPTGYLHVGNARTAIINWLISKQMGEPFILRFDDTDTERSSEKFILAIKEDLNWLGLTWDFSFKQSERTKNYDEAFHKLKDRNLIYPCYETDDELSLKRALQRKSGMPPVYDRAALNLTKEEKSKIESNGRVPHWRFKLPDKDFFWEDAVYGKIKFNVKSYSDPVLIRADGRPLYTLTSVVDDSENDIKFIVRGSDHLSNSGAQIALFLALDSKPPAFAHHPLLVSSDGDPLSKRLGSLSLSNLSDEGIESEVLMSYLSLIGSNLDANIFLSKNSIISKFNIKNVGKSNVIFDKNSLGNLNQQFLRNLSFTEISSRLNLLEINDASEDFWLCIRENISNFNETKFWWDIIYKPISPKILDKDYIKIVSKNVPSGELDADSWKLWTSTLSKLTDRKGKSLFLPIRQALTGLDYGPSMDHLLPLIGIDRVKKRLLGQNV